MPTSCTRCAGTGFLNTHQLPDTVNRHDRDAVLRWIEINDNHDICICDCCGDGEEWYGIPGEHYNKDDPPGHEGPYAYNGGFYECH